MNEVSQTTEKPVNRPRRRRRWIVLTVVTLLFIAIWSIPYVVSSPPGERLALRIANQAGEQKVTFSDMSLTWLGPIRLRELHVEDPATQAVIDVESIVWSKGLLTALGGVENFGDVQVDQPRITIPAAGLAQKKDEEPEKEDKGGWSDKQPRGRLTVNNGYVRITRADGEMLEVKDINTQVSLDTLDAIKGDFQLALSGGGKLQGDFDVAQASAGLEKMQAKVNIATDEAVNLEPFAVFAGPDVTAGGLATLKLDSRIADGQMQSDFNLSFNQLQAGRKTDALKPVNITLAGNVKTTTEKIIGEANLTGDIGNITDRFEMARQTEPLKMDEQTLMAALLGEEQITLPEFSLTSDGYINLATLAGAVPSVLNLRPGLAINEGRLTLKDIRITGGSQPAARGGLEISRITGSVPSPQGSDRQEISVEPLVISFDAGLTAGGLQIQQTRLQSDFLEASVQGDLKQLDSKFQADLQALENQLAMLFEYQSKGLSGRLNGASKLTRQDDGWSVTSNISGVNLAYPGEKAKVTVASLQLNQQGQITLQDGKTQHYRLDSLNLNVDNALQAQASGDFSLTGGGFQAKAGLQQLNLDQVTQWAKAFKGDAMTPLKGNVTFQADITQAPQTNILTIRGSGKAENLLAGEAVPADAVNVDYGWDEIRWDPTTADLGLTAVSLNGRFAQLAQQNADDKPLLTARVEGTLNNLRQNPTFNLKGDYQSFWPQVTQWLHRSFPDMKKNVSLEGVSGGPFTLTGPLRASAGKPAGSGLSGNFSAGWTTAALYGMTFGKALFDARLQDGVVTLPDTTVTAGEGAMNLGGKVDLTATPAVVYLSGKRNILVKLPVTPAVGDQLLSRFNPIFANLTQLQGSITLDTVDLVIPLSKEHVGSARGSGSLDMSEMKMQPGGLLAELLPMDKFADNRIVPVRTEVLNFQFKDGGIYYDKFRITVAEVLPLNFRGQIGFDDKIKMWVSAPLSMPLLEQILTKAGRQMPPLITQNLEKIQLEIPIVGTRLSPKLDLSAIDIGQLLKKIVEGSLQKPLENILDILTQPKDKPNERQAAPDRRQPQ